MNKSSTLRIEVLWVLAVLLVLSSQGRAAAAAPEGKVDLPLQEYLGLLETAERIERRRRRSLPHRKPRWPRWCRSASW